jgi:thiamine-phosphate pyrophosphorylase
MLHRFYPIVPDAEWVRHIVPLGVKTVQLRIKNRPDDDVRTQIGSALAVCKTYDCTLIVNDYWRLAIDCGASFVHLGQEDLRAADLKALRGAGLRLGLSTHSHEELQTALQARPDYIALGPIYETKLKVMPWAPQGLERIAEWKVKAPGIPLVAIGGITLQRAADVLTAGADMIAVVTDIVADPHPEQRVKAWLDFLNGASANPESVRF